MRIDDPDLSMRVDPERAVSFQAVSHFLDGSVTSRIIIHNNNNELSKSAELIPLIGIR